MLPLPEDEYGRREEEEGWKREDEEKGSSFLFVFFSVLTWVSLVLPQTCPIVPEQGIEIME
jgi:hypothetical protein